MIRPPSPTACHLLDAIEDCPKSQKEIARDAGFASPNILSMMKRGETKVPINRIPCLAHALEIDPAAFLVLALKEYEPELYDVLTTHFGIGLSHHERTLLEVFDEAQHVQPFHLEAGLCDLLLSLFIYSGRLQAEVG